MKKFKYLYMAAVLVLASACTKKFEEINTNPNAPISAQPELLLRQVVYDFGDNFALEGYQAGNLLGQQFTKIDFNLFDRHALLQGQNGGDPWPIFYQNLRDNELLLNKALEGGVNTVYEGPSRILKAYMTISLTDMFGDVPYFEAFKGKTGNTTPAYDAQRDIYLNDEGIISNLDKAITALEAYQGAVPLKGDILFSGDLSAWVKFANSLKIKALMRISGKEDVSGQLQAIYNSGNYMQFNADNATFDFTNSQPNAFRIANLRAGDFASYIMSETMDSVLTTLNDSRIAVLFRPTANDPVSYEGLRNGPDAANLSISIADYSLPGKVFRENTERLDCNFLTAWETNLFLAEAAEKGIITASGKALYDQAVQQAFDYWLAEMPTDYLITGPAAYGFAGTNPLEQIITQKWIANTTNGYEGWIEWKRTGFPLLKPITASLNNNIIPVRMPYPTDEAALNSNNFSIAASATNGNSVNSPVWWAQ